VALRESVAKWKIVIGHHTIKSAGHHGNTIELEKHLLPILQVTKPFHSYNKVYAPIEKINLIKSVFFVLDLLGK